jgi:NAD(P)-dependent dehydrogenase (short-subunit alcohol dehydrogenase family)
VELAGSLAVVTGATAGIGRALAFALGKAGAKLAICARTETNVRATVAALSAERIDAIGVACDVANPTSVRAFADDVLRQRGAPRILVNNAGVARFAPLEDLSLEDWDATMDTNLRSAFLVTKAFLRAMKDAGGGAIVNISSLAGKNAFEQGSAYCASKHGLMGFARCLMLEVRKHNIRVVTCCPGSVATQLLEQQSRFSPDAERILLPEDVAHAVVATLTLPDRATVSELDIRPTNP